VVTGWIGLVERDPVVHAVQLVQVDAVGAQPVQRRVDAGPDVLGRPVAGHGAVAHHEADLGREEGLVAPTLERPADELLVGEGSVDVGGVDQRDTQIEGPPDHPHGLVVVALGGAVGPGHAHAAQADRADFGAVQAQSTGGEPLFTHAIHLPVSLDRVTGITRTRSRKRTTHSPIAQGRPSCAPVSSWP
jgi:hypothetical protein